MSVVRGMPEVEYHGHPALSSTGVRKILEAPAVYDYYRSHPEPPKKEFDVGTLVHSKVLGVGAQIEVIPDDYLAENGAASTNKAKDFIKKARDAGLIPMKTGEAGQINRIAEAVLKNQDAKVYLEAVAEREVSVFADHPDGVPMRCRFDLLTQETKHGRAGIDLKTTAGSADLEPFVREVQNHGYHIQDVWYEETAELAGLGEIQFKFIFVSKTPPYLNAMYDLDVEFLSLGRTATAKARRLWLEGNNSGKWTGLPPGVRTASPQTWFAMQQEDLEIQV